MKGQEAEGEGVELDLDEIKARISKMKNADSPEAGWLMWFDIWDIERLVEEVERLRGELGYYKSEATHGPFGS